MKLKKVSMGKVFFVLSIGLFVLLEGCGDSTSSTDSTTSYAGPGSKWDISFTGSNFTLTRRENATAPVTLTVLGTTQTLSASGLEKLTVTSVTGSGGPSVGDTAWGIEIPGYVYVLKPMSSGSSQMIAMVVSGSCPGADFTANWVTVKKSSSSSANDSGRDFFGTFDWDNSASKGTLPIRRALSSGFPDQGANNNMGSGACSDGIMQIDGADMYLTQNGGAIVHTGTDSTDEDDHSFIFGLTQKSISDLSNLTGSYVGILFDQDSNSGEEIQPVSVTCSLGSCTGNIITDIDAGTKSTDQVTISLSGPDSIAPGLITGTITSGTTGNLACMVDINAASSGKKLLSCTGQSPGDNTKLFNVLLVSI